MKKNKIVGVVKKASDVYVKCEHGDEIKMGKLKYVNFINKPTLKERIMGLFKPKSPKGSFTWKVKFKYGSCK